MPSDLRYFLDVTNKFFNWNNLNWNLNKNSPLKPNGETVHHVESNFYKM